MGFFDRFFGNNAEAKQQPKISFGRYSDSYKSIEQYEAWDRSLNAFEGEEYLKAYREFFFYLRDEKEANVVVNEENGEIHFELFQGSKKLTGNANINRIRVEARIAQAQELKVAYMLRLIKQNYALKYSRFAVDDEDNIVIIFDSFTLDGSPYKLYYAIKEVATNADKQDDLLLDEFVMLHPVEMAHIQQLPNFEKQVKYDFVIEQISAAINEIDSGKLNPEQYPGGLAYLFLNLSYKLDFLVRPEGYMMEMLERVHRMYFANDGKTTFEKLQMLQEEFKNLGARPKEDFFKEFYKVKSTFGITNPANHDRVVGFINGELPNMDWYHENGYDEIALAVPGYIVGYCMFNYAVPAPDRALFFLYYQITEAAYFNKLGFKNDFYKLEKQSFNKRAIKRAIKSIVKEFESTYPHFAPDIGSLNYDSMVSFAKSYLMMIKSLNLVKSR